ncbi:MAG: sugar phosphate isomerase/epimerase [Clostridia bacterium]|nr:sugar phosphate isomerase/epimerase [Clostridia bacterium]
MELKLGVTNAPLNRYCKDETEGLRIIAESGFDCIDYYIAKYELSNPKCNDTQTERQDYFLKLKDSLSDTKTEVHQTHAVFPAYVGDKETDALLFESLRRSIEATSLLGAKYMVVHPVKLFWNRFEWLKRFRKKVNLRFYRSLLPYLKEYNVTVALENMFTLRRYKNELCATTCSRAEEMIEFLEELDDAHFTLCFDSGHANVIYKDSGIEMVRKLGERISICHLHDNNSLFDEHLLPYQGDIDWNKLIFALRSSGYKGVLNFECHYADRTSNLSEAKANLAEILKAGQQLNEMWENIK